MLYLKTLHRIKKNTPDKRCLKKAKGSRGAIVVNVSKELETKRAVFFNVPRRYLYCLKCQHAQKEKEKGYNFFWLRHNKYRAASCHI